MNLNLTFFLKFQFSILLTRANDINCPEGNWVPVGRACYTIPNKGPFNHQQAMDACKKTLKANVFNAPIESSADEVLANFPQSNYWLDFHGNGSGFYWPHGDPIMNPNGQHLKNPSKKCLQSSSKKIISKSDCLSKIHVICKQNICPDEYDELVDGKCYKFFVETAKYDAALAACKVSDYQVRKYLLMLN